MQWTEVKTKWNGVQGKFKTKWPKLTDGDLKTIAGNRDKLVARLFELYKTDKVQLGKDVDAFILTLSPAHV